MLERFKKLASSLGPGLITAALVLGPGSITMVSKAGASLGYKLIWVTVFAGVIMGAYTTMAARIGTVADRSLLRVVGSLYGRWLSVVMGLSAFAVCSCFQAGDNLGVGVAMQALFQDFFPDVSPTLMVKTWSALFTVICVVMVAAATHLYRAVERVITALVILMIVSFFANLVPAHPSACGIARGLIPSADRGDLGLIVPIVATTFSVIAALYQAYMVQNKGWRLEEYKKGNIDSLVGIGILTALSVTVMITAAAVLNPRGLAVKSAGDMAVQLEPLLGRTAKYLFAVGLWGASFSSQIANAIVGGGLLSDGLGWGARFETRSVKACTIGVMLVGAFVAQFWAHYMLDLIVIAQGITIIFVPLCAGVLMLLANNRQVMGEHTNRAILNVLGAAGFVTVAGLGCYQVLSFIAK